MAGGRESLSGGEWNTVIFSRIDFEWVSLWSLSERLASFPSPYGGTFRLERCPETARWKWVCGCRSGVDSEKEQFSGELIGSGEDRSLGHKESGRASHRCLETEQISAGSLSSDQLLMLCFSEDFEVIKVWDRDANARDALLYGSNVTIHLSAGLESNAFQSQPIKMLNWVWQVSLSIQILVHFNQIVLWCWPSYLCKCYERCDDSICSGLETEII